jgi:CBS domain-containing protein
LTSVKTEDTIEGVMTRTPVTVKSDTPVRKALQVMVKKDIGSLVVVKKGKPVGIITERDVTRRSLRLERVGKKVYDRPVTSLMSHPLVTVVPGTPVWEAFEKMVTRKIRRLPVVEKGGLVGIVTERDLFKWVIRVLYAPNIPRRIERFLK